MSESLILDKSEGRSLRSGFLQAAARHPASPALVVAGTVSTYAELERDARVWAGVIVDALGHPARRVGVLAYRTYPAYAGVLAALCSGAAFVPLNRNFPVDRTRMMIRDTELDAIIVDAASAGDLAGVLEGLPAPPVIVCPDEAVPQGVSGTRAVVDRSALTTRPPLAVLPPTLHEEVAYILFTSGTTGKPKGIPVTHGNVLHFIDVVTRRYAFTPADRFSQTFDQTFDLSIFDLFVAWESGACVFGMQPLDLMAPGQFITRHALTVWFSVPSVAVLMAKRNALRPGMFPTLRWSLFCGEPLPRRIAEIWQAAAPNSVVENLYGPTELTIACFHHRWDPQTSPALCANDIVPIGRPFAGLGATLLDENLQPVALDEPGELCVCGPQTVPGYWRDPAKTAERFIPVPLSTLPSTHLYRTGDRTRRLPNGEYAYLGRSDDQIKVLGHRVEPAEIEGLLRQAPGVVQAVALGWPVQDGVAEGIVAFVSGVDLQLAELDAKCRAALPRYMVPREIVVAETLPLNSNGKINRDALRAQLATMASHPLP